MTVGRRPTLRKGDRVRVTKAIMPGPVGTAPKVGDRATVETQREDGTVLVKLDDGRRALLASWEVEKTDDDN